MPFSRGARFGPYEIDSLLGVGGMGEVYRARDTRLDRDVAIALIRGEELDEAARERIRIEARAVARLAEHPRIVPVFDSGDEAGEPYVVSQYLEATEDVGFLDETVPFLDAPLLAGEQSESYFEPRASDKRGTLFEHCARTLDRSLGVGPHGLPLMGTGDWNDGMNRVGAGGKGESVWLGWFLHAILGSWAALADGRDDTRARTWRRHADALRASLEGEAWDGDWYRRAYFDDGTPLGAAANDACRIDSIAQSWSVLSGAADDTRSRRAMAAVDQHLVRRRDRLVLLLTPERGCVSGRGEERTRFVVLHRLSVRACRLVAGVSVPDLQ